MSLSYIHCVLGRSETSFLRSSMMEADTSAVTGVTMCASQSHQDATLTSRALLDMNSAVKLIGQRQVHSIILQL